MRDPPPLVATTPVPLIRERISELKAVMKAETDRFTLLTLENELIDAHVALLRSEHVKVNDGLVTLDPSWDPDQAVREATAAVKKRE